VFVLNNWYVAAFGHDLSPLETLARRICDQPVVIYRTHAGRAVALEDRCSHRAMPLSLNGHCEGDTIRCPYHGLTFGPSGECVRVPSQTTVPGRAAIRSYPLVEQDGALWIWMGVPEAANPALIPNHPYHTDPNYTWNSFMVEFAANWILVLENLCDLTHISFVHTGINGDSEANLTASVRVTPLGKIGVKLERRLPNSVPPLHYLQLRTFKGNVDRWQEIAVTPNLARFWTGAADVNTGAFEGRRDEALNIHSYHAITPKTATSCYYHFSNARNFALDDLEVSAKMTAAARQTIDVEDRPVIEAQQLRILDGPDRPFVDVQADAAGIQLRRIIARMAREEAALSGSIPQRVGL
jgi:phenylpropionate dioxygenase-like ring-hydroxylating dioxygenase large terminal subunit